MIETRDYVTIGTDRLPDGSRKPNTLKYLSVYLNECTSAEDVVVTILNGLLEWKVRPPQFSFTLDIVGGLLGQPRPDGFNDIDYMHVLVARSIVRVSDAEEADVVRLAAYLSSINGGLGDYTVIGGPPEHWSITLFDVELSSQWYALYVALIFDCIGATDSFLLTIGTTATALYDDEGSLYDVSLYG